MFTYISQCHVFNFIHSRNGGNKLASFTMSGDVLSTVEHFSAATGEGVSLVLIALRLDDIAYGNTWRLLNLSFY
jgi:hypothetical protein